MSGNEPAEPPANGAAPLERDVDAQQTWWREQWLRFPTVREDAGGGLDFWAVAPDSGVYQDDWPRGERLARETLAHMRRFPEGASVLRRILARIDYDSTVAQGFVNHLEEVLARPHLYPVTPEETAPPL
jgi:hypothetical protein